jgi:hypothetical protein
MVWKHMQNIVIVLLTRNWKKNCYHGNINNNNSNRKAYFQNKTFQKYLLSHVVYHFLEDIMVWKHMQNIVIVLLTRNWKKNCYHGNINNNNSNRKRWRVLNTTTRAITIISMAIEKEKNERIQWQQEQQWRKSITSMSPQLNLWQQ